MNYSKILVPYDGSESAQHCIQYVADMMKDFPESKVVAFASLAGPRDINRLLGLTQDGTSYTNPDALKNYESIRQEAYEKNMARLKKEVGEVIAPEDIDRVEFKIEFGASPVRGILKAIEEYECDSVVIGTRGSHAFAGSLGSIAFGVARSAEVPVTIIK